ncbi:MAG: proline/glycine betaine ABC transporter permease [Chloroflexales bacterium]|nr:proline/glycine betaine ABC transporter permease [Chloroflexales bacterium]
MDDNIFDRYTIPVAEWVETGVDWLQDNAAEIFLAVRWPIEFVLDGFEALMLQLPWYIVVLLIMAIGWLRNGWKIGLISGVCLMLIGFLGFWESTMTTLSMIVTAVAFCVVIGVPLGILSATNDRIEGTVRPLLDAMQTIHPFVYLVPIVIFFRVGNVPGTMATIIFALPPIVRLTNLGIRQVPHDVVEAGKAFGSSNRQLLFDVQLPLALSTIMAGLNQTLMLALSMVVIVALIGGGGLGEQIFRSVGRVDTGGAVASGLAVMLLAIVLDRISQVQRRAA